MFKTPTDFQYDVVPDSADFRQLFRIQRNDYLEFRLFANDGFKLIDLVSEAGLDARAVQRLTFKYLVEYDGLVKLPLLGRVKLADMTIREAEMFLEDKYSEYYNRPFVQLFVTNRRVVVFPGAGGDAQVVNLENNNTTLLEVLANARGLPRRANASKVKLFRRGEDGHRQVFLFDLSDIDGLKYADIVMQGDDILYVQPNPEVARELLYDLTPLITLLTTTLLVIGIANSFSR
ncbi:MAG: polysaccharide biosynthesis/export family protein [Flavobacteriales bacterium]|nr:polysaccharide biosynthesis/export family protein [Flavobacteriales bacterium]